MTVLRAFQRESGWCELSGTVRVLPLSFRGKPRRASALRSMRKERYVLLNLGGTTRAFVPFGGGGVFIFSVKVISLNTLSAIRIKL